MTAISLKQEFGLMRLRFQRTLVISIGLHAVFFGWLIATRQFVPPVDNLVEITWLESLPLPKLEPEQIKPVEKEAPPVDFGPTEPVLSVKEKLARDATQANDVRERLQALQPSTVANQAQAALPSATRELLQNAQATMAPITRTEAPDNLNRGATTALPAVALTRGPARSQRTAALDADLPFHETSAAAAEPAGDSSAARNLGGATLSGLVADRQLLEHTMPVYPGWATSEAMEATVTLYFLVAPGGGVLENVQVRKTAGSRGFDENAVAALRQWRFVPLAGHDARQQWGTITFRYRLQDRPQG